MKHIIKAVGGSEFGPTESFYGPFDTPEDAGEWGREHLHGSTFDVVLLSPPWD